MERLAIQKISDRHQEVIRMLVLGFSQAEIAQATGFSQIAISNLKSNPLVRAQIDSLQALRNKKTVDLSVELQKTALESFDILKKVQSGTLEDSEGNVIPADIRTRANVAFGIMDRAGYGPVRKVQGEIISATLTTEDLEEIKSRASKARMAVIDGEFEIQTQAG